MGQESANEPGKNRAVRGLLNLLDAESVRF